MSKGIRIKLNKMAAFDKVAAPSQPVADTTTPAPVPFRGGLPNPSKGGQSPAYNPRGITGRTGPRPGY